MFIPDGYTLLFDKEEELLILQRKGDEKIVAFYDDDALEWEKITPRFVNSINLREPTKQEVDELSDYSEYTMEYYYHIGVY